MARALSLVVSVLLVSSSSLVAAGLGRGTRRLLSRDVLDDFEECTGSEWETDLVIDSRIERFESNRLSPLFVADQIHGHLFW